MFNATDRFFYSSNMLDRRFSALSVHAGKEVGAIDELKINKKGSFCIYNLRYAPDHRSNSVSLSQPYLFKARLDVIGVT